MCTYVCVCDDVTRRDVPQWASVGLARWIFYVAQKGKNGKPAICGKNSALFIRMFYSHTSAEKYIKFQLGVFRRDINCNRIIISCIFTSRVGFDWIIYKRVLTLLFYKSDFKLYSESKEVSVSW